MANLNDAAVEEHMAKVEHFMGVTQMTDPVLCGRILEAHEWNLEAAVHTALGMGDMGAALDEALARQLQHEEGPRAPPRAVVPGVAGPRVQRVQPQPNGLFHVPILLVRNVLSLGVQVVRGVLRVVLPGRVRGAAVSLLRALQRPALPPTEAAAAFVAAFEQVVDGAERPAFCVSSYREALTAANREHKFLLVYLHAPEHQETPDFCRRTLCAPEVVDYLRENYVVWGGDIRQPDAFQLSGALRASTFPFLAVLANQNSRVTLLDYLEGSTTPHALVAALSAVLDAQGAMLVAARADVEQRVRAQYTA